MGSRSREFPVARTWIGSRFRASHATANDVAVEQSFCQRMSLAQAPTTDDGAFGSSSPRAPEGDVVTAEIDQLGPNGQRDLFSAMSKWRKTRISWGNVAEPSE